jgi:hypothetical protein
VAGGETGAPTDDVDTATDDELFDMLDGELNS